MPRRKSQVIFYKSTMTRDQNRWLTVTFKVFGAALPKAVLADVAGTRLRQVEVTQGRGRSRIVEYELSVAGNTQRYSAVKRAIECAVAGDAANYSAAIAEADRLLSQ